MRVVAWIRGTTVQTYSKQYTKTRKAPPGLQGIHFPVKKARNLVCGLPAMVASFKLKTLRRFPGFSCFNFELETLTSVASLRTGFGDRLRHSE